MNVAFCILHYNTREMTERLMNSIPGSIVIDNGSDREHQITSDTHMVIRLSQNYGFSEGWNRGVKLLMASGKYQAFALLNSDITISKKSVQRIKELAESYDIFTLAYNCWVKACQPSETETIVEVPVIEFTAPVISARVFNEVGYFDSENFPLGYGVEYDYLHRAKQKGFKIYCDRSHRFDHLGSTTIATKFGFREYTTRAKAEHHNGLKKKYGANYFETIMRPTVSLSDFSKKIAVYTTIFGNYDTLKPHPWSQINATWYCLTDSPNLTCTGWKTVLCDNPHKGLPNRLRAKFYKMFPWEGLPKDVEISIFIDGSVVVTSESFIESLILYLYNDMVIFQHPWRDCIYDEVIESRKCRKYDGEPLEKQVDSYRSIMKPHSGLYACGIMVRRHTPQIKALMGAWWWENIKWSYQDQLSFPMVCQMANFKPTIFPQSQIDNNLFKLTWHDDK